MAINLRKGGSINLDKGLSIVGVGLGWGSKCDLDASAFMLGTDGQIPSERTMIFYNNLCGRGHQKSCPGCKEGLDGVRHTGDDRGDDAGEEDEGGDRETLIVDLSKVPANIKEIIFVVTIDGWEDQRQNFGQVRDSYIRIVNQANDQEIARYELAEDFSLETAVEFGKLCRPDGTWKFSAIGVGFKGVGLDFFVDKYARSFK